MFVKPFLSVFSEIGKSQALRRLVLLLLSEADHDQDDHGNHIGHHLDEVGDVAGHMPSHQGRQELVEPVEQAEQVSTPDGIERFPGGKDDQGQSQPAQGLDLAGGRPDALIVIKDIVEAADTGDTCTDAGCQILVFGDIDTCCICRCRILTHCTKVEADTGFGQHQVHDDGKDDGHIDQEAIVEDDTAENAQL